jgi:hypothetical protein
MVRKVCADWHRQPGCQYQPLFNIDVDHIVIDGRILFNIFTNICWIRMQAYWLHKDIKMTKTPTSITGVEKKNDDFRRYFHRKINRWDAATNLLLVEKRQEELRGYERRKRNYVKQNKTFWFEGGKQDAAKKVKRISTNKSQMPTLPTVQTTHTDNNTSSVIPQVPLSSPTDEQGLTNKNVPELLSILQRETGRKMRRRTRKTVIIDAIMASRMN